MDDTDRIEREALDQLLALLEMTPPEREARLRALDASDATLAISVRALLGDVDEEDLTAREAVADVLGEDDELPTDTIGSWRLISRIGRGGMGEVFLAERSGSDFQQRVALKRIWAGLGRAHARFHRERQVLARLEHPHIARLIDGGVDASGSPWFAMEYVDGAPITQWCDARKATLRQRVEVFRQVCEAVGFAHRNLVVHRDLKPGNILVDASGQAKLLDFGIARLLDEGDAEQAVTLALTPAWSAPEQRDGRAITTATDVYQLGVLLRALLSGDVGAKPGRSGRMSAHLAAQRAVRSEAVDALAAARSTSAERLRTDLRGDLDAIVQHATQDDPAARYATADALSEDLWRWLNHHPLEGVRVSLAVRARKFVRRNVAAVSVATVLGLGLLATTAFALLSARNEREQRAAAQAETERTNALIDYMQLMFRDASRASDGGSGVNVEQVLRRSAADIGRQFAANPREGQATLLMLADFYQSLGDHAGARPVLEQLLRWPGIESNPDVRARALAGLALVRREAGDHPGAFALMKQAMAIWDSDPKRYAVIRNTHLATLAFLQDADGDVDRALQTLDRMIVERRDRLKLKDRVLAQAYNTRCGIDVTVGNFDDAMADCQRALDVLALLHQEHAALSTDTRNLMAVTNARLYRFADAEKILRRVLADHAALYGEDSADYAGYQFNLGVNVLRQGRTREGLEMMEQAAAVIDRKTQPNGGQNTTTRIALAGAYARVGRTREAAALLVEAERRLMQEPNLMRMQRARLEVSRAQLAHALGDDAVARQHLDAAEAALTALGHAGRGQMAWVRDARRTIFGEP